MIEVKLAKYDYKYSVTDGGVVYSYNGNKKELVGRIKNSGYREVLITHNKRRYYILVHRLVAEVFIINSEGKRTVNYKNGIKTDNRADNLEWMTDSENLIHARDNDLLTYCKITNEIADKIRNDIGSNRYLSKKYGIGKTQIGYIKNGKRWKKKNTM